MKIHNVTGSSKVSAKPPYPYTSWLKYWEAKKGFVLDPNKWYNCPACGNAFQRKNFDGCHVQKYGSTDRKWYIIPLCDSCNQSTGILEVDETLLVPVPSNC